MKLLTLGDSLAQGFRSLAAARTDQSFSTLLAQQLGATPYRIPEWPAGGLPVNIEHLMRALEARYETNIRGFEWLTVLQTINGVLDEAETYYERGAGADTRPYAQAADRFWHNVAFWGATVADAWQVTPRVCKARLRAAGNTGDDFLGAPSEPFYRTALRVLNPQLDPRLEDISQVGWLEHHARSAGGVENVIVWLGSNNALGTVVRLNIRQTPNDPARRPHEMSFFERDSFKWNLWHPEDFDAEYRELIGLIGQAMAKNKAKGWRVFLGTVPEVTIAPLAKGVGATTKVNGDVYFKYYTYFPFEEDFAHTTRFKLTLQDALHIDRCIQHYNRTIKACAQEENQRLGDTRYVVVDVARSLHDIAWKRNDGQPKYVYPSYFDFIYPRVDTKYYHAEPDGRMRQGGLFSLDGVHPTAIGHGLIAWDFLKAMKQAGVAVNPDALDWPAIFASDSLFSKPIRLMGELYEHRELAQHVIKLLSLIED